MFAAVCFAPSDLGPNPFYVAPVHAAPAKAATPEPVEACPEWKTAGGVPIYKCIDELDDSICYVPVGGVMQCLKD